jgi:predicted alpha/beta superfamily hydrolase
MKAGNEQCACARAVLILLLSIFAYAQSDKSAISNRCTSTATGDLEIRDFHSVIFHNTRKLRILLPQGYRDQKNAHTKYPVLYLNDGQNLFDVCTSMFGPKEWKVDETANRLIAEGKVEPLIIVAIDNAGRHEKERLAEEPLVGSRPDEYLPFPDESLDPPLAVVHGANYPSFLTREVMPFIEKNYRVKTGPENTGLGGSSYGGLITFYVALHTHGVFGRVLIESPSLYVKDYAVLKQAAKHKDWPARIYFGGGTEETPPDDPETVLGDIAKAVQLLQANGVAAGRILVNITPGHHDDDAWAARFPAALAFLFPAQNQRCPPASSDRFLGRIIYK